MLLSFPDLMKIFLVIFIMRFITPQLSHVRDILLRLFKEQLAFLRENSNLNLFFRL